jgi:hypothetical protein
MTYGLESGEWAVLRRLRTPEKVQDFLNALPANFELRGETYRSPRRVLRDRTAHCFEGALLAAAAFLVNGKKPLLMDLRTDPAIPDGDHVVALFKKRGLWGAVSKTNHAWLRYREPIYRTVRELALSYFHEYIWDDGRKSLRAYSRPVNLRSLMKRGWLTDERELHWLVRAVDRAPHAPLAPRAAVKEYRLAEPIELAVGELEEWSKTGKRLY